MDESEYYVARKSIYTATWLHMREEGRFSFGDDRSELPRFAPSMQMQLIHENWSVAQDSTKLDR